MKKENAIAYIKECIDYIDNAKSDYAFSNNTIRNVLTEIYCKIYDIEEKPKEKWIPVSERLPKKNVEVLATTESGYVTIAEYFKYDHWFIHEGSTNAHTDDLIVWMPLPKPYTESEVEE